jgi:hypothetical protein
VLLPLSLDVSSPLYSLPDAELPDVSVSLVVLLLL